MIERPTTRKTIEVESTLRLPSDGNLFDLLNLLDLEFGKLFRKDKSLYSIDQRGSGVDLIYTHHREETEEEFNKRVEEYETKIRECKSTLDFIRENYGDDFIKEHLNYKEE